MKSKTLFVSNVAYALFAVFLLSGCLKDDCKHTYKISIPQYKSLQELRATVKSMVPIPFINTAKLYVNKQWIFLNEKDKGIHVIDNTNPLQPQNSAFINLPGNVDMTIKGDILYADLYCDIAAIDISNPNNIIVKKYLTNIFPQRSMYNPSNNPDSINIIVNWLTKDTVVTCQNNIYPIFYTPNCPNCATFSGGDKTSISNGAGGSMARFTSLNNYMYTVTNSDLNVVNITDADNPLFVKKQNIGWNIETIFPHANKLFIGAGNSMSIYDVQNPENPKRLSWNGHWCSGDPVVADDKYAYVTLHEANACGEKINQLEVYDLKYESNPELVKTYPLTNPQGLSKDDDLLFICDGKDGFKIYDVSNVKEIKLIKTFTGINAYDVIALNGIAYVSATEGLYQYSYSNVKNIYFLSKLNKAKP